MDEFQEDTDTYDESQEVVVVSNQLLMQYAGNELVSSALLGGLFLPSERVPEELLARFSKSKEVSAAVTAQSPLLTHIVEFPYWNSGSNQRPFDRVSIGMYGAICLAGDRTVLDTIITAASQLDEPYNSTLEEVLLGASESLGSDVDITSVRPVKRSSKPFSDQGYEYFWIDVPELLSAVGTGVGKSYVKKLLERLRRMSVMRCEMQALDSDNNELDVAEFSLLAPTIIRMVDKSRLKNDAANAETVNAIIIGVSKIYLNTLPEEGVRRLTRRRFQQHYPKLMGRHSVDDFFKYLENNERAFLHNKRLRTLIASYLSTKAHADLMFTHKGSRLRKIRHLLAEIYAKRFVIEEAFDIVLKPMKHYGGMDYCLLYKEKTAPQEYQDWFDAYED